MKAGDSFILQKTIWTDADYDEMVWHDVHIHGIAFRPDLFEVYFDIDHIFAWVDPEPPSPYYTFWLAPCTWVFSNVYDFKADAEWAYGLAIIEVSREHIGKPRNAGHIGREREWRWTLSCEFGDLSFVSVGFQQFVRQEPVRTNAQAFTWAERNGVCFDMRTYTGSG